MLPAVARTPSVPQRRVSGLPLRALRAACLQRGDRGGSGANRCSWSAAEPGVSAARVS